MKILVFDTETTGKYDFKMPPDDPGQPDIVQFAGALYDEAGNELTVFSSLVAPEGWAIPPEAAAVHGITEDKARNGTTRAFVNQMFNLMFAKADLAVGHNIDFDILVMETSISRDLGMLTRIEGKPIYCTMKTATPICRIPGRFGKHKWPKLSEAYRIFFDEDLEGAHDALVDVRACARIYFHLQQLKQKAAASA